VRPRKLLLLGALGGVAIAGAAVAHSFGLLAEWGMGPAVDAGDGVLEGWIRGVELEDRVVHVTGGFLSLGTTSVAIEAGTDIRVHDKIGSIEDLRDGLHVQICYEARGEMRRARTVEIPPSPIPCRVVATALPSEPLPPVPPPEPPPRSTGRRAGRASAPASAAVQRQVQPSAAPRAPSTPQEAAFPTVGAAPTSPAETVEAHDYGALVDWVLRR
jgi:hypothetical protein